METLKTDILVIGTGIAGLSFALRAAEFARVIMATKKEQSASATNYAQGGIASVLSPADSFEQHVTDTLRAGAGLCREDVVRQIVGDGPDAVRDLVSWGVAFTQAEGHHEDFHLGLEGGHSHPRVVHAGDFTGRQIEEALLDRAQSHPNIDILEHHIATRLLMGRDPASGSARCYGAEVLALEASTRTRIWARSVLLATGGAGQVYQHTTNPTIATGDGLALAYHAGARVANLEFMQFHPTSLYRPGSYPFLISEAVRGEGAVLRNDKKEPFMAAYDQRADLAPRDIVARAIDQEIKRSGAAFVHLDITHKSQVQLEKRSPNIYARLKRLGIDMATDLMPVVPAAHYLCGGVICDLDGRTDIPGLYVSGEVACTGMHGANRLASNSLLEAVVVSRRAAAAMQQHLPEWTHTPAIPPYEYGRDKPPGVLVAHIRRDAAQTMWDYVGIVRTDQRLERARAKIKHLRDEADLLLERSAPAYHLTELDNLLTVAELMVASASLRRESRGLHFNRDCPEAGPDAPVGDTVLHPSLDYVTA